MVYSKYHKYEDGTPEAAAALLENIGEKLEKEGDSSMVKVKMAHLLHWKGIFCMRCLDQKKGNVRGIGFGVTPKMFTKSNIDVIREKK
ncbi:hypothetical protein LINPERPRIM_LOCUS14985 [Linum perenne]